MMQLRPTLLSEAEYGKMKKERKSDNESTCFWNEQYNDEWVELQGRLG